MVTINWENVIIVMCVFILGVLVGRQTMAWQIGIIKDKIAKKKKKVDKKRK